MCVCTRYMYLTHSLLVQRCRHMKTYRSMYILHTYSYTNAVTHIDAHTKPHISVCTYMYTYTHAHACTYPLGLVSHIIYSLLH